MSPEEIRNKRLYLLRYDRGSRAHSKLIRQLKVLKERISEGIPRWQEAMRDARQPTRGWSIETTSLGLDFECYVEIWRGSLSCVGMQQASRLYRRRQSLSKSGSCEIELSSTDTKKIVKVIEDSTATRMDQGWLATRAK
jgi:hypothetical protein